MINNQIKGIIYTLIAMFVFSVANLLVKILGETEQVSTFIILFFRLSFSLVPVIILTKIRSSSLLVQLKNDPQKFLQFFSGFSTLIGLYCLFKTFLTLPLGDAQTISYSSGIFVIILAYPILKEKVTKIRLVSVLLGLLGIIIVSRPGADIFQIGILWGLAFSVINGLMTVLGRKITQNASSELTIFYVGSVGSFILLMLLPFFPHYGGECIHLKPLSLFYLCLVGIGGGIGQLFLMEGLKITESTILTPFFYISILWGILFDWFFWQHFPTITTILGASIIIASNLIILKEKNKK